MVRRKLAMEPIKDKARQHTTFTKRRCGLEKKALDFCRKFDSMAAIITFSEVGNAYVFAHPHIDTVLLHYEAESPSSSSTSEEDKVVTEMQKRIGEAMKTGEWEKALLGLGSQELDQLIAEVENIKSMLFRRKIAAEKEESRSTGNN